MIVASTRRRSLDFDIGESCPRTSTHAADVADGHRPGVTPSKSAELRGANRRIRLLEQENEVLRRPAAYPSQADLPRNGSARS